MKNIIIYSNNLDEEIWVSLVPLSVSYKYTLEIKDSVVSILSLENWEFWKARELLKSKYYLQNVVA